MKVEEALDLIKQRDPRQPVDMYSAALGFLEAASIKSGLVCSCHNWPSVTSMHQYVVSLEELLNNIGNQTFGFRRPPNAVPTAPHQ
jgi:hypothetical protein